MPKPAISIVIVNWNVRALLEENLARLFALTTLLTFEVFVVDNGSTDGSAAMVRTAFPQVHLIQNDFNAGFAVASNRAARLAQGEIVLFFNPDMRMGDGVLERVQEVLTAEPTVGAVTVKLVRAQGDLVHSVRRDPTLAGQLALLCKLPHLFPRMLDTEFAMGFDYGRAQDIEQTRGAFLAMRADVIAVVGLFDERFFLWFEDIDLCRRIRAAGFRLRYLPDVSCRDFVGRSFAQVSLWRKQKLFFTSCSRYFLKWGVRSRV